MSSNIPPNLNNNLTQAQKDYHQLQKDLRFSEKQQKKIVQRRKTRQTRQMINPELSQNVKLLQENKRLRAQITQLKQMWNETQYRISTYEEKLRQNCASK